MGINPKTITDATTPSASPADVATALDMFATILKSQTQAPTPAVTAHWYSGAVPRRTMLGGGGGGSTVGAGARNYFEFGGRALTATENLSYIIMPFAGNITKIYVETLSAQPAGGILIFTPRLNGVDTTSLAFSVAGGEAAGIKSKAGLLSLQAGDFFSLTADNNNAAASAQIGSFALEFDQNG